MPYIKQERRTRLDIGINQLLAYLLEVEENDRSGELNYIITMLLRKAFILEKYYRYNSALGVLEAVKLELHRKKISLYEDLKGKEYSSIEWLI